MTTQTREVFFFIRAYNDLDIQFSLIKEFAEDPRFNVRVIMYASDGFVLHPDGHEAVEYMTRHYGIVFESVLQMKACPAWLRIAYKIQKQFFDWRNTDLAYKFEPLGWLLKFGDVGMRKLMKPALAQANPPWFQELISQWNPDLVFTDEVLFQVGRSGFMDHVIPALTKKGAVVYSILTGHRVYQAVNPTGGPMWDGYRPSEAKRYFVPSALNKQIYMEIFPKENITIAGNLRMDREWINFIHDKIVPNRLSLPDKPVKIVMMLSKMNYGVEEEQIKETIRRLGSMEGVALAIKPHTRGMKFDFMPKAEIGHAVIVDKVPSAALIEWGDITLMTGSSIVFHVMLRNKIAGFLKYCQQLETIFEDGKSCEVFESLEGLVSYIEEARDKGIPGITGKKKEELESFIRNEIHGGVADGLIARNYKNIILKDLKIEDVVPQTEKKKSVA